MREIYNSNVYYLVRHGEAENNVLKVLNATERGEYRLTERGRQQIEKLAGFLQSKPIDFIVTSPLLRAYESAEILRKALTVPLSFDVRLCEPQFGSFEGKSIQSFLDFIRANGGRTAGDTELHIEGYMDIRERVQSLLSALNGAFQGQHVVLVSHMDTLQELYAELLGEPVGTEQFTGVPKNGSCIVVATSQDLETFIPEVA